LIFLLKIEVLVLVALVDDGIRIADFFIVLDRSLKCVICEQPGWVLFQLLQQGLHLSVLFDVGCLASCGL